MGSARRYFGWVPHLARDWRVVRLDLRGHGASQVPPPEQALTLDRLVADVAELLDHLGVEAAHVVGNSAGGYLGQQLAMTRPERVRSLALYGSTPGLKNSQAPSWIPQIQAKGLRGFLAETIRDRLPPDADPGLVEWFLDEAAKNDPAYIGKFVLLMASYDWSGEVEKIRCPTLVVIPGAETVGSIANYEPSAGSPMSSSGSMTACRITSATPFPTAAPPTCAIFCAGAFRTNPAGIERPRNPSFFWRRPRRFEPLQDRLRPGDHMRRQRENAVAVDSLPQQLNENRPLFIAQVDRRHGIPNRDAIIRQFGTLAL